MDDDAARAAQLSTIGRMATLVAAINELIDQSPDPAAIRHAIVARVESVAGSLEADENLDHMLIAMQMRDQLDDLME